MFPFFSSFSNRRRNGELKRGRRRGSALIETALCLTFVLLPVTLGGFQMAMIFITSHALQQVARESVRWSAVHYNEDTFDKGVTQGDAVTVIGSDGKPTVTYPSESLLHFMRGQAAANGIAWADINGGNINVNSNVIGDRGQKGGSIVITPATRADRLSGQPITIVITYPMRQRAFLGALFFKNESNTKLSPLQFGFLKNDWTEASTTLME